MPLAPWNPCCCSPGNPRAIGNLPSSLPIYFIPSWRAPFSAPQHSALPWLVVPNQVTWRRAASGTIILTTGRLRRAHPAAPFTAEHPSGPPSPKVLLHVTENSEIFGFRFGLEWHQNDQIPNPPQKRIALLCPVQDQQLGVSQPLPGPFASGFAQASRSARSHFWGTAQRKMGQIRKKKLPEREVQGKGFFCVCVCAPPPPFLK